MARSRTRRQWPPFVRGSVEVVHLQEEPHPAGDLVSDRGGLVLAARAGEQDAGLAARRPDDDPPPWSAIIRQRWRVLDQIEAHRVDEELDGSVVVVYDYRDQIDSRLPDLRGVCQKMTDRAIIEQPPQATRMPSADTQDS